MSTAVERWHENDARSSGTGDAMRVLGSDWKRTDDATALDKSINLLLNGRC